MSRRTATARASDWPTVAVGPIKREIAFQSGPNGIQLASMATFSAAC
jgi:hypothetical protein